MSFAWLNSDNLPHPERILDRRGGYAILAAMSLGESTVVPIPLETVVVPLMLSRPARALKVATAIWLGCLVGAALLYLVGLVLFDPVVRPILDWLALADAFSAMKDRLQGSGLFWAVFLVSISPAPMQLAAVGAGALSGNFAVFMAAIMASRGVRYYGMGILAALLGPRLQPLLRQARYVWLAILVVLVGWAVWKFVL